MTNIQLKYLQFFQHTAVCMRQLCLKSSNYIAIETELNIIFLYKEPSCNKPALYPSQMSLIESHLIKM